MIHGKQEQGFDFAFDILALTAQLSAFVVWPLLTNDPIFWLIPVSLFLISAGWWENFLSETSAVCHKMLVFPTW